MNRRQWAEAWAELATIACRVGENVELVDLARQPPAVPDGFPSGGAGRGPDIADPTGNAVAAREDVLVDEVRRDLVELMAILRTVRSMMRRADRLEYQVAHRGDVRVAKNRVDGQCRACGRYVAGSTRDRLRSGYCRECYIARDADKAEGLSVDYLEFIPRRREALGLPKLEPDDLARGSGGDPWDFDRAAVARGA